MPTFMQRGREWFATKLNEAAGVTVTYTDPNGTFSVTGVAKWVDHLMVEDSGKSITIRCREFIFTTADLPRIPQKGGRLVEGGATYEVLPEKNRPGVQQNDHSNVTTLVRAKLVGT